MIRSLLCFALNLLLLAALAAGDEGDFQCSDDIETHDATLKGNMTSPLYGKRPQYPNMLRCKYEITAPVGHIIKLTFKDFDVEVYTKCERDVLNIYGKNYSGKIATLCGSDLPRPILSTDNGMRLDFITDFIQGGRGFVIEYESGPNMQICEPDYNVCKNRNCFSKKQKCDGVDDCGDGTDEENCGHVPVTVPNDCGTPEISPRISQESDRMVGGEEVVPNSWPWQVSLQLNYTEPNGQFCGGALINTLWVLTAGHCIRRFPHPGDIKVVLGSHNKFTKTKYEQVRWSDLVIAYEELVGDDVINYSLDHDIGLIRLNAPVELNAGVHPACLPAFGYELKPGQHCYATGWGETRGTGSSDALKQTLQIVLQPDEKTCETIRADTQICVGNPKMSSCHGDSGGPLVCLGEGNKWFLMGDVSQGVPADEQGRGMCAGEDAYTLFTATAPKRNWIEDMIQKYNRDV